jgi:PKD repeat protein
MFNEFRYRSGACRPAARRWPGFLGVFPAKVDRMMLQKSFLSSGKLSSVLLALLVLGVRAGYSQIIPAGRTPPGGVWHAGVPGGIPHRTTIYKTLSPGATAAQIAAACQSCPSNQVVFLSAGTYYLNGAIEWYNNYGAGGNSMTLRGAGLTNTILVFTNASWVQAPIQIEGPDRYGNGYPDSAGATNSYILSLASGYTQGSTNLTLSSPQNASLLGTHAALQAGTVICIDQLNDSFVDVIGSDGGFQLDASALRDNGIRAQQQYVVVKSISNGTNLTIWPPIYMTNYQAALKPQIWWWGASMEMSGIEDLTIDVSSSQHTYPILFWSCDACWAKDVHIIKGANSSVYTYNCANVEVRDSFFDQSQSYGSGSYGVQFSLASACLCENNIFSTLTTPMMASQGASGNVFAYNFCTNGTYYTAGNAWMPPSIEPHYVHNHMNLFEGNYGTGVEFDFTHGSASHNTLFRNRLHGPERSTQLNNTFAVQIQATNWWMNIVGNVLGSVGWHNVYSISVTSPASDNDGARSIYKFGFVDDSGSTTFGDPKAQGTALIHANWDAVTSTNGGIVWDPTISTHSLPASLYLSGKPSWWGNAPWPPFDPANPSASATNLPAAYRFIFGLNPPSGGATNLPPVAVASGLPLLGAAPLAVNFSSAGSLDPEGAALTYSWTFGDGGTSTAANPSHTYSASGVYSAYLSVSDGTNTTQATALTITATNLLLGTNLPPVAVAGGAPLSGTVPLAVNFSSAGSSDPEGAALTYFWTFGDGGISTTANPSHTYASAGTFSAHLSVSDGTNTTPATAITITATNAPGTNLPPVAVAKSSSTVGATPLSVTFSSVGSSDPEGAALTYSWAFGDGATSTAANPSHTYATAGTYSAVLTVSDGTNQTSATAIPITTANVSNGPVAVYGFDEGTGTTALDTSGNGNTGTVNAAGWTKTGKYGGALSFNGTSSMVTVNDSASLDLSVGMTLEAWVNPTALNAQVWMNVIIKPLAAPDSVDFVLQGSSITTQLPSAAISTTLTNLSGTSLLPLNTWSHLAATYDGATMRLYVNGVQVASAPQTGPIAASSQPLTIGSNWSGLIDEVRIYNRALSASQILTDMNSAVNPPPAPPSNLRLLAN